MEGQEHHKTIAPASAVVEGHEGHGAHICHICGWPFPNPHPNAKHRRAHKKVCGTIEGYKIVRSADENSHLAVDVDGQASDDDEHSPSPKLVKGNSSEAEKSEDEVFSDAVTGFSDSKRPEAGDGGKDENAEKLNGLNNSSETIDPSEIKPDEVHSERVVFLTSDADAVNPPILDGLRDTVKKPGNFVEDNNSLASEALKSFDKTDSELPIEPVDTSDGKEALAKNDAFDDTPGKEDATTLEVLGSDAKSDLPTNDNEINVGEKHLSAGETKPRSSEANLVNDEAHPSVTDASKVSEGMKKGEEITDEEAKCIPSKGEADRSTTTVKSILDEKAVNDQEIDKDGEEGNSPERYLIENGKEKKKTKKKRSFWAPFLCCSSVHRDL